MMNTILTLDQHKLGLFDDNDTPADHLKLREAARAVLIDGHGQVALMHFRATGSYKLPGGGHDEGETMEDTLHREIREETGYTASIVAEIGVVEEFRYYAQLYQNSYCWVMRAKDYVGVQPTKKELKQGMELIWVDDIGSAIERIRQSDQTDEDESIIGLAMMKQRDIAILEAAKPNR
jgi:8-oxo-dGTP diphosphatase